MLRHQTNRAIWLRRSFVENDRTGEHFVIQIQHTVFQCAFRERSDFIYYRVTIVKQTGDDSILNHINNTTCEMRQCEKVLGQYKLIIIAAVLQIDYVSYA